MYQEDYASLLNATETGMKITYNPQNIMALTSVFKTDLQDGTKQVNIVCIHFLRLLSQTH